MARVLSLSALLIFLAIPHLALAKGGPKIGVVNMQRAVGETKDGKRAEKRLRGLKKNLEVTLNKKMKAFMAQEAQLRKQWAILKDSERRKRAQENARKMQELRKEYITAERKLMKRKAREMMKISRKLNAIIQKIARRDRYDYIFANAAVLWAPRHVDLTNEVIRLYNQ
jgi:outer membrane protein